MKAQKLKVNRHKYLTFLPFLIIGLLFASVLFSSISSSNQNLNNCNANGICKASAVRLDATYGCGSGNGWIQTSINFGCQGDGCPASAPHITANPPYCGTNHNGIVDLLFAIIRFLSDGVGLIVIASVIIGGIQYIISRGDPNATQTAIKRLTTSLVALLIFVFAYAILNYVVPAGFFNQ